MDLVRATAAPIRPTGAPGCRAARRVVAAVRAGGLSFASDIRPIATPMTRSDHQDALIVLRNVSKQFSTASGTFTALADVDLTIDRGDFAVIVGQSGSGKSTLLGLLGGIDR